MAAYRLATHAKLAERRAVGARDVVERRYHEEAERLLAGYGDAGAAHDGR